MIQFFLPSYWALQLGHYVGANMLTADILALVCLGMAAILIGIGLCIREEKVNEKN